MGVASMVPRRADAALGPRIVLKAPRITRRDSFRLDSALLIAYLVCCAIVLVLLPMGGTVNWIEVGPALVLQVAVGMLLAFGSRLKGNRVKYIGIVGVVGYLVSVALLRDGATPTAGYGPLVLLPVVWASLRGRRHEFAVAVIGVGIVYVLPTVLIGPPQYPAGGWRAGLLFVVLSTALGWVIIRLVGRVQDLVQQLEGLARTDALTGLPNRRGWEELLEFELSIARRSGQPLTVALLDLDHFKDYNDTHGHLAADRLLLQATAAWQAALRETDVLARWGGDEFGLLLPGCGAGNSLALLERMRAACPAARFSVGLTEWDGTTSTEEILAIADGELYGAKRACSGAARLSACR